MKEGELLLLLGRLDALSMTVIMSNWMSSRRKLWKVVSVASLFFLFAALIVVFSEPRQNHQRYQKIQLRPRQRHVELFVNPNTDSEEVEGGGTELKTEEETKGDTNRVHFATLDLKGTGFIDKLHMLAGKITTLYVLYTGQWQEAGHFGSRASSILE